MIRKIAYFLIVSLIYAVLPAYTQQSDTPNTILEACNAIVDSEKRLKCMQELIELHKKPIDNKASIKELNRAFSSIKGAINSGISLRSYQELIIDPAKAVSIFKSENPNTDTKIIDLLEEAINAYTDAATVWKADIFDSRDGGIFFGKILPYNQLGLTNIVNRYKLATTIVLSTDHLPLDQALNKIWLIADEKVTAAFEELNRTDATKVLSRISLNSLPPPKSKEEIFKEKFYKITGLSIKETSAGVVIEKYDESKTKTSKIIIDSVIIKFNNNHIRFLSDVEMAFNSRDLSKNTTPMMTVTSKEKFTQFFLIQTSPE